MKRQGMKVTVRQLRNLTDDLNEQARVFNSVIDEICNEDSTWQINIINKEGASDTWELETYEEIEAIKNEKW